MKKSREATYSSNAVHFKPVTEDKAGLSIIHPAAEVAHVVTVAGDVVPEGNKLKFIKLCGENNKHTYVTFVSFKVMVFIRKKIGRLNTQACTFPVAMLKITVCNMKLEDNCSITQIIITAVASELWVGSVFESSHFYSCCSALT